MVTNDNEVPKQANRQFRSIHGTVGSSVGTGRTPRPRGPGPNAPVAQQEGTGAGAPRYDNEAYAQLHAHGAGAMADMHVDRGRPPGLPLPAHRNGCYGPVAPLVDSYSYSHCASGRKGSCSYSYSYSYSCALS